MSLMLMTMINNSISKGVGAVQTEEKMKPRRKCHARYKGLESLITLSCVCEFIFSSSLENFLLFCND